MAKKNKSGGKRQSEQLYSHLAPHNQRSLGSNRNHDHEHTPGNNFRRIDQVIPNSALRTVENYEWNPKTERGEFKKEPADLMDHARHNIDRAKFGTVTSGARQRYKQKEGKEGTSHDYSYPVAPHYGALAGHMGSKPRKDRY